MGSRNILQTGLGLPAGSGNPAWLACVPAGAAPPLRISRRLDAGLARMLVRAVGEVDLATAPALADALERARSAAMAVPGDIAIEVDLCRVGFLSAAGLTVLVRAHHRCYLDSVVFRVVADHRAVTRPLRLTGLDQLLELRARPSHAPG